MKFMKKRKIRRIASLFMAVLMVAALMPGSITNTKADDKTAESGVVVDAGTWENNERTTTWDFSKYSGSSSLTLAEGDEVGRIKVAAGKAYVKTGGAGLSAQKTKDAVIAVPVDPTATSATLTLKFFSNNNNRYVYVGDKSGENAVICLNTAGREELPNAVNINGDKEATVTVSSAAFEDGYILLTPDTLASGDSGEMKIKNLKLVESKDNGDRTWNFRKGSELIGSNGKLIQGTTGEVNGLVIDATTGKFDSTRSEWAQFNTGAVVKIPVKGSCEITIGSYKEKQATIEGTEVGTTEFKYQYSGAAGYVDLVATADGYIGSIEVKHIAEPEANVENFTFVMDEHAVDGVVKTGEYKFGDSTLTLGGQTVGGVITQYTVKPDKKVTINGVEHDAYTSGKRHADANNIPNLPGEGDGCLATFTPAAKGMMTVYYNSTSFLRVHTFNADGTKEGFVDSETGLTSYSFKVVPGKTYVMSTTGKTNNMFYAGYSYVADEKITVPVTVNNIDATIGSGLRLSLVDDQLGGDEISLSTTTKSLKLLKGHTYRVSSNDGGVKPLVGDSQTFTVTGDAVTITLNNVPDVELTGKIVGTDSSNVTKLVFTNNTSGTVNEATITGDSYKVSVKPGEYTTSVETKDGSTTYDRASVKAGAENVNDVYVEKDDPASKRDYSYTRVPSLATAGSIAVENGKPHTVARADSSLTIPVKGKAKVAISTYYAFNFTVNGEKYDSTETDKGYTSVGTTSKTDTFEIVVEGDAVVNFGATTYITGISVVPMTEFKSEINVPGDYDTLNKASDAILGMQNRPEGEAGRVTINLTSDVFEQVVMAAPYVTLKGNGHTISWYYGVGTKYYSIDPATGLYNKTLAMDRYSSEEGNGSLWGGVFIVRGNNFVAENTTFLNTYNYYLTEAEKTDIAGSNLSVDRLAEGADVSDYKFKERSNAFYIEADNIEVFNCSILSSQDTLGRNGSTNYGYHAYFNGCTIGGNVDYICGEFAAVFDNCKLQWKTYKNDENNNAKIGYIVAPKTSPYVFRNCEVTTDGAHGDIAVLGKYGRTWGANSNASFIECETNGYIDSEGWTEMSNGEKASAIFNEYNNTNKGEAFVTTGCTKSTLDAVVNYIDSENVSAVDTVLGTWKPVHYKEVISKDDDSSKGDVADGGETGKDNNVNGTTESTGETVKTGDTAPIALYVVLMLCALAGIVFVSKKRRISVK
ncbi:pectinesterase family protein [Lachnospira eligens]|uniref:Pectinesterase A n=1 Tax=Lachnospira eligens TaxID=39485 RepID=A0A174ZFZ7_9FIRM|nr:pectinesterase family protein [Lachnospira eligens]CUQ82901.1 Pectinesterase A precursor [Lachnospira eligens]